MNLQLTTEVFLPALALTKWSLYRWFKKNKGKERRHCEKPLLTVDHKQRRVAYANEQLTGIGRNEVDIYLDEKNFYPWSRRKSLKHMPRAAFEEEGVDWVKAKKAISICCPVKTMFMAAITKPSEQYNFEGKIAIIRVSRQEQLLQDTYRQKFHDDHDINQLILTGDWRRLYKDNYTNAEILLLVKEYYELEEDVELTVCIQYVTRAGVSRTRRWVRLREHERIEDQQVRTEEGV